MVRLMLGLPTALQVGNSYAILFHDGGVSEFKFLTRHPDYRALRFPPEHCSRRIWVLGDSNSLLPEPASIFGYNAPIFVLDAASPRSKHLRWLDKVGHQKFYVKPWTISEVLQTDVGLFPRVP